MDILKDFDFQLILRPRSVDGDKVRYDEIEPTFLKVQRGVYLILEDNEVVYCGKFTKTFGKRWLYTKEKYIYHFSSIMIAEALRNGKSIEVWAQEESKIKDQLDLKDNPWVTVSSIEENIIRNHIKPEHRRNKVKA